MQLNLRVLLSMLDAFVSNGLWRIDSFLVQEMSLKLYVDHYDESETDNAYKIACRVG